MTPVKATMSAEEARFLLRLVNIRNDLANGLHHADLILGEFGLVRDGRLDTDRVLAVNAAAGLEPEKEVAP